MKRRTLLWILLLLALCAAAGIVFLCLKQPETASVTLPAAEYSPSDVSEDPVGENDSRLEITCDNVQAVIATLKEQETYSRDITVTRAWSGGKKTDYLSVRRKGDSFSIEVNSDETILLADGTATIAYGGTDDVYTGPAADSDARAWQGLIDFSEVLALSRSDILDAGYCDHNGVMCIYVRYEAGLPGYVRECYASVEYGLLMGCTETDETGATVYEMESGLPDLSTPDDSYFVLS